MNEQAYSTSAPTIVAAFKATADAFNDSSQRARADAEKLGKNKGALITKHPLFGVKVIGLEPDNPNDVPEGWRLVRGALEPRRGKPGEAARKWLADHQPPDLRAVLAEHGAPRTSRREGGDGRYFIVSPQLVEHDGTVWVLYKGEPDGECTWELRKLSEFYAAMEAAEAAEAAEKAAGMTA